MQAGSATCGERVQGTVRMRRKLLLTIGLAVLGACVAAGNAIGQGRAAWSASARAASRSTSPTARTSRRSRRCRSARTSPTTTATGSPTSPTPTAPARSTRPSPAAAATPSPSRPSRRPPTMTGRRRTAAAAAATPAAAPATAVARRRRGGGGWLQRAERRRRRRHRRRGRRRRRRRPDRDRGDDEVDDSREPMDEPPIRTPDGAPTNANPSLTIADFGPAPIGVPNFVIDQFTIPPFLLPIYQACGTQYGIPWQVLASINRIETAFGTNLNVSSAGALGWMQFMPATWEAYGVDANSDGRKDPYNPVDAICAAARYLKASGGQADLATAIFAYNHADWYVDEVLLYARQYGRLPDDLVGSLTGLTEGARFPVAANARYADDISERRALERSKPGKRAYGNAAEVISSSPTRRGIDIYSREGAPVVAVNDGVIIRDRQVKAARPLHRPARRLWQPVHLREAGRASPRSIRCRSSASSRPTTSSSSRPSDAEAASRPRAPASNDADAAADARRLREPAKRARAGQHRGRARAPLRLPRARRATSTAPTSPASSTRCSKRRVPRLRVVQVLLLRRPAVRLRRRWSCGRCKEGSKVIAGHRARPDRQGRRGRAAPALRDPPRRPRRAEDRPEADPRRLEAARGDRDLPRRGREPVRPTAPPPARCC